MGGNHMIIDINGSEKCFAYDEFHDDKKPVPETARDKLLKTCIKNYVVRIRPDKREELLKQVHDL